jgi:cephalosporin hydroxylase
MPAAIHPGEGPTRNGVNLRPVFQKRSNRMPPNEARRTRDKNARALSHYLPLPKNPSKELPPMPFREARSARSEPRPSRRLCQFRKSPDRRTLTDECRQVKMKYSVDTSTRKMTVDDREVDLYSDEAFELLSDLWLKVGWNQKYVYTFSWFGIPIIQLPSDILRYQEVITQLKPDVIIETGIAHGGSAIFVASLCKALGRGRVIAVDIDIRAHNRKRIEAHPLFELITLFEGSSVEPQTVGQVRKLVRPGESVLVLLDSNHSYDHVMLELEAYSPLVSIGSYIIAADGSMQNLSDVPRGSPDWVRNNSSQAALDFARDHPEFEIEQPKWPFNESTLSKNITHWPNAWLKRLS